MEFHPIVLAIRALPVPMLGPILKPDIVFVFLSNRTHPSMENRLLIDHSIRPRMLKLVHEAVLY